MRKLFGALAVTTFVMGPACSGDDAPGASEPGSGGSSGQGQGGSGGTKTASNGGSSGAGEAGAPSGSGATMGSGSGGVNANGGAPASGGALSENGGADGVAGGDGATAGAGGELGLGGAGAEASFQGLGFLSQDNRKSYAAGVSADGTTVAGSSYVSATQLDAMRWRDGQMIDLAPEEEESLGQAASGDGDLLVLSVGTDFTEATLWDGENGLTGLGMIGNYSNVQSISADGHTVVGYTGTYVADPFSRTYIAFRSVDAGALEDLGKLAGADGCEAYSTSADGSVIIGSCDFGTAPATRGFQWNEDDGMTAVAADADQATMPLAVSGDGLVLVGSCDYGIYSYPCYWDSEGVQHLLGAEDAHRGYLSETNGNGSVAVGMAWFGPTIKPILWDEANGIRALATVLADLGVLPENWAITNVTGISADGKVIVGNGVNPNGNNEAWIAHLP